MFPRVLGRLTWRSLRDRASSASPIVAGPVPPNTSPSCEHLDPRVVIGPHGTLDGSGCGPHRRVGRRNFCHDSSVAFAPVSSASNSVSSSSKPVVETSNDNEEAMSLFGFNVEEEPSPHRKWKDAKAAKRIPTNWWNGVPKDTYEVIKMESEMSCYFQTCVFNGDVDHAERVLRKMEVHDNPATFHILLRTRLKQGRLEDFVELLRFMISRNVQPDADVFALTLAAYGKYVELGNEDSYSSQNSSSFSSSSASLHFLRDQLMSMRTNYLFDPGDILRDRPLLNDEKRLIKLAASSLFGVDAPETSSAVPLGYDCHLVNHLNATDERTSFPNPYVGAFDLNEAKASLRKIWEIESSGQVYADRVDKLTRNDGDRRNKTTLLDLHREIWRKSIREALQCHLSVMKKKRYDEDIVSLHAYVKLFTIDELTDFLVDEIDQIVLWTHQMAFPNHVLAARIGRIFAIRAVAKQHRLFGDFETYEKVYSRYLEFYAAEERRHPTERHFWESMREEFPFLNDMDVTLRYWPQSVRLEFGHLLFHVIVGECFFNPSLLEVDADGKPGTSGEFSPVFLILTKKIKANPDAYRLYDESPDRPIPQSYPSTELPTRLPPMPWVNAAVNGTVLSDTAVIRFDRDDKYSHETLCAVESKRLYPPLDALNHLGSTPWTINGFVLDVASQVFNSGGCPELALPLTSEVEASRENPALNHTNVTNNKNWFSALNNLTIAQLLRDQVFWHPHQMDYRGRCTPIPAFLSHHGPDLVRGLITFGNGKPLGEKGMDWLKIHAINVAGSMKSSTLAERLAYADEIMDDILDSAHRPLEGAGWWKRGDKPWETLAACKEIADALATSEPTSFLSRLPIHQDGSCNSFQHFSALARDERAGELVNLCPSERPKDPYTDIVRELEKKRRWDAMKGRREAIILEGYLDRSIVKKIIMRVGYGASRDSAIGYVEQWLQDMEDFPRKHVRKCSQYIGAGILECNDRLFQSSGRLRRWLVTVADIITAESGSVVFWNSPLGLPIHQPPVQHVFVPNYIHALDAAHMMLTALHAYRRGVSFCAVHDCFWTHAGTVDEMNEICRQQFLKLHSSDLLEDLRDQCSKLAVIDRELPQIPPRGNLDIEQVVDSVYFFQ